MALNLEKQDNKFRVVTQEFSTAWLPDTPGNRKVVVVMLRYLVDAHGKPPFKLQELCRGNESENGRQRVIMSKISASAKRISCGCLRGNGKWIIRSWRQHRSPYASMHWRRELGAGPDRHGPADLTAANIEVALNRSVAKKCWGFSKSSWSRGKRIIRKRM